MTAGDITIRSELRPGDLGRVIALHGTAYIGEQAHFGPRFEAYVARTVAEFVLDLGGRGRIFLAERGDALVACAAMIERAGPEGVRGQLRWVLADPSVRGLGVGRKLVEMAVDYARAEGWPEAFLETTSGLDASMGIYRKLGFAVAERKKDALWTGEDEVITMRLKLK